MPYKHYLWGFLLGCIFFASCRSTKHSVHQHGKNEGYKMQFVNECRQYLGVPYKLGGNTKAGMDCSGLVVQVFKNQNINLPRTSHEQAQKGKTIPFNEADIGDLIFFATSNNGINHVGIVTAIHPQQGLQFIHASTSKGVREDFLSNSYWNKAFVKVVRVE